MLCSANLTTLLTDWPMGLLVDCGIQTLHSPLASFLRFYVTRMLSRVPPNTRVDGDN